MVSHRAACSDLLRECEKCIVTMASLLEFLNMDEKKSHHITIISVLHVIKDIQMGYYGWQVYITLYLFPDAKHCTLSVDQAASATAMVQIILNTISTYLAPKIYIKIVHYYYK